LCFSASLKFGKWCDYFTHEYFLRIETLGLLTPILEYSGRFPYSLCNGFFPCMNEAPFLTKNKKEILMDQTTATQYPDWLSSTLASDVTEGLGVLPGWIHELKLGSHVVGPAFIAVGSQDDNQVLKRLKTKAPPPAGYVLVVGGQSTSRTATIGNLMALEIQNLGFAGLVTDGLVRDSSELRQMEIPIWCRGVTPIASAKREQGTIGGAVAIGGALVWEGDWVIADDDGVVIWPKDNVKELLIKAREKLDLDAGRLSRLIAGI
jgi:4-hydroxy-4-methyl-2-oxoglutarate aldolase